MDEVTERKPTRHELISELARVKAAGFQVLDESIAIDDVPLSADEIALLNSEAKDPA